MIGDADGVLCVLSYLPHDHPEALAARHLLDPGRPPLPLSALRAGEPGRALQGAAALRCLIGMRPGPCNAGDSPALAITLAGLRLSAGDPSGGERLLEEVRRALGHDSSWPAMACEGYNLARIRLLQGRPGDALAARAVRHQHSAAPAMVGFRYLPPN